jgi:protein required for attachment to host cells
MRNSMTRQTNYDPRWARHGGAYVVVAASARARILKRSGPRQGAATGHGAPAPQLLEVERLEREGAHLHARELEYELHAVEVERFARQLTERLLQLGQQDRMEELVLIAEPRFLGLLRRELPAPLRQRVTREVARDLTGAADEPIAAAAFALPDSPGSAGG